MTGCMLFTICSYLERRTFRLKLGGVLSREFVQKNGILEGGVLTVTFFIVKMNSFLFHFTKCPVLFIVARFTNISLLKNVVGQKLV